MKNCFVCFLVLVSAVAFAAEEDTCRMKIGMNFTQLCYYSREQPFVDLMKSSSEWLTQTVGATDLATTGVIDSIPHDSNGYPLQLPVTVAGLAKPQIVAARMSTDQAGNYPAGEYTVLYDGSGTLAFSGDATITSQSTGMMHLNVVPTNYGIVMRITFSNALDHIRNIRVLMPGTAPAKTCGSASRTCPTATTSRRWQCWCATVLIRR